MTIDTKAKIEAVVKNASSRHILGRCSPEYSNGFIEAFCRVYKQENWLRALQHKFFLPNEANFEDQTFFQGACELSVANHVRLQAVTDFEVDKNVNPTNGTDVDVFFQRGAGVSIEVKCPVEPQPGIPSIANPNFVMSLRPAGRIHNYPSEVSDLISSIESSGAMAAFEAKNKDATLKSFLVEANRKFNPDSSVDDLNVLFLACGDWADMANYYTYLYGINELFTSQSFHPPAEFRLVDVVVLSSLRYRHEHVRDGDDWTLRNVFLLPRLNPHGRNSRTRNALDRGLSVFDHHRERFDAFDDVPQDPNATAEMMDILRLHHYSHQGLSSAEKARYFPVVIHPLDETKTSTDEQGRR